MPQNFLSDVNVVAISLVDKGANRKKFYLRKNEGEEFNLPASNRLVKAQDWSAVYCVVAEPGWEEKPGQGAPDPEASDLWKDDAEIRTAAHRFMKNGGLVNKMHETLDPYGSVVENFVAPADFTVNEEVIKAGSWVVAIEPSEEGRAKIENGEFTGVSIQGTGHREIAKGPAVERNRGKLAGPLKNLVEHYKGQAHPFEACVRDNRQRFGAEAERVCSVLKGLGQAPGAATNKSDVDKGEGANAPVPRKCKSCGATLGAKDTVCPNCGAKWVAKAEVSDDELEKAIDGWLEQDLTVEDATLALNSMDSHESKGWLKAIGKALGVTAPDDETSDAGSLSQGDNTMSEENTTTQPESITKDDLSKVNDALEKNSKDVKELAQSVAQIAQTLAEKQGTERDPAQEVYHRLDEVSKAVDGIREDVGQLAKGESHQPEQPDTDTVNKNGSDPLAGLLD